MWREGIDVLLKMWNARGLNCLQSSTVPYMSGLMLSGLTNSDSVKSFKESLYMKIILFFVII